MNTKTLSLCIVIFLLLSFDDPLARAEGKQIIISEIQTIGDKSDDEFIELYNQDATNFDLSGLQLRRRTSGGTESSIKVFDKNSIIPPHGYFLWANTNGIFATTLADTKTSSSALADNNSIALFTKSGASGVLIDSIAWGTGALFDPSTPIFSNPSKNKSLTRNITTLNWSLLDNPTPTNSHGETYEKPLPPPPPDPLVYKNDVRLNEILANPSGDESANEFIELFNTSDVIVDLSSWAIKDASASEKYVFPNNTKIQPKSFLVIYRSTFLFALNNSDETVSLLDPNGESRDTVSYKTTKEDTSYNYTSTGWRGGTPTPGAPNEANILPETSEKVLKKGYRGVALDFAARGEDSDRDTLKHTWDFGDGHKSYKEKTTHTYEENGTYTVMLKTSDGKDDVEETFTLKIESYPRREIRIISLLPNPEGKDSGKEWLLIENREKKTVNLKGYSIATGWKTMSNHPIREDFFIKSKKQATLTHDNALFTLPNQKGKIELRAPDGKVLQNIHYKLDKPVADNMVYRKEKGNDWKWDGSFVQKVAPSPKEETMTTIKKTDVLIPNAPESKTEESMESTEENMPTETGASSPAIETRSDQISLNPDRLLPQDILAYGTRVQTPDSLTLDIFPNEKVAIISVDGEISTFRGKDTLLSTINIALNDFLNAPE